MKNENIDARIKKHPVLTVEERETVQFFFEGKKLIAKKDEVISSALFANGIKVFGKHSTDGSPQGIFCANGQCAQCTVIADGKPVKSCMTPVKNGMTVEPLIGMPSLPNYNHKTELKFNKIKEIEVPVLIAGGGPAGLNAASELGKAGIKTLLIDDKSELGGKLTLQTHSFFGSIDDCYAGTRGIDIAKILTDEVKKQSAHVEVWLNSTAVAVFNDKKIGIVKDNSYVIVKPQTLLIACGAREKSLAFKGCDLPGVYGAGAFQTLVNRDLIKPCERLFVIGGGNVGVIAAYHAIQAGITVVGLAEALKECGGYKVHVDKMVRLGIPLHTSHTVLEAMGDGKVEQVKIAEVDDKFRIKPNTEKVYDVDTVLIAVGLSPIDELYHKAKQFGMNVYSAGDAEEIAEASAAIFSGKITGRRIARDMGKTVDIPEEWEPTMKILKSRPGQTFVSKDDAVNMNTKDLEVYPVIRCVQEIPCNPCVSVCHKQNIVMKNGLMDVPQYTGDVCSGCLKCVAVCPGLAIVLVNKKYDAENENALITIPYELQEDINEGDIVETVDMYGNIVGSGEVIKIRKMDKLMRNRKLIQLKVPYSDMNKVASLSLQKDIKESESAPLVSERDDIIVCRCERVSKGGIKREIENGVFDMNLLKAKLRCGMGACGGKTCESLIYSVYREMGIDPDAVVPFTKRPFVTEIPLKFFAGFDESENE